MVSSFLLIFGRFRMGSALRGRGKARISPFRRMSSGITPACTWKRQTGVRNASHSRDHPPRVRGKAAVRAGNRARAGITPACAGKSAGHDRQHQTARDHPRVCGEKTKKVQENQRSFAACSSNFIQFLVHCKRQAAVRQRAMRARNIQTKVRGQRSQLVIRHVVQLTFGHPQCVRVGVFEFRQTTLSAIWSDHRASAADSLSAIRRSRRVLLPIGCGVFHRPAFIPQSDNVRPKRRFFFIEQKLNIFCRLIVKSSWTLE